MACILSIETSGAVCSVAVSNELHTVWAEACTDGMQHAERLPAYVSQAMYHVEREGLSLSAVAVSIGPGSYTGLRIGLSTAKGLCYGRGVPLVTIPTLDLLCVPVLIGIDLPADALLCPMIDARRMEVYAKVVNRRLLEVRATQAEVVDEHTYDDYLRAHPVYFFGSGATKCKEIIHHENAVFLDDIVPLAKDMQPLADKAYLSGTFADVAYTTPYYLKSYHTTTPKTLL